MRLFTDDSSSITDPHLRRARELALRGMGTTSPNPVVGCVVVSAGRVVGEGWHERAGGPHAEVVALQAAGDAARGSTVYVTLEPCAHHGRTPPCTEALVAAGVTRVVIGMPDPSETARGGADLLRSAGIEVSFASDPSPFAALNVGWLSLVGRSSPWVTVKVACTLDGRVSAVRGSRTQISSAASSDITMTLRSRADAVLIGAATALVDDPALTVRDRDGSDAQRQPLRVVLARTADVSSASLFADGRGPSALLVPEEASIDHGLPPQTVRLSYAAPEGLRGAVRALAGYGCASVLVEAGPSLLAAFWAEDLIDEVVLIHAGKVFGEGGVPLLGGTVPTEADSRMRAVEAAVVGDDAVTVWRRAGSQAHGAPGEEG